MITVSLPTKDIRVLILAILVMLSLQPYFIWSGTSGANAISGIMFLLFAINSIRISSEIIRISSLYLVCGIYYYFGGTTYHDFSPILFLSLCYLVLPNRYKLKIFLVFRKLLSAIFFLGIVVYVIRFFVTLPFVSISALNDLKNTAYHSYIFEVTLPDMIIPRFMSIFDEPGVVGTVCALLISYKGISLRSFEDVTIFLAGLLSMSLAFYIILFLNIIFRLSLKNILYVVLFGLLTFLTARNNIFSQTIFARLEIVDGKLSGDNRMNTVFADNYDRFLERGGADLIFGRGLGAEGYDDEDNKGSSSYAVLVCRHGVLGCFLFVSFFFYLVWVYSPTKRGWFYFVVFILLLYQRINLFQLYNIVLFVGGLLLIDKESNSALRDRING